MHTTYTQEFASNLKANLKTVTADKARRFLLKHGYTSTRNLLPEYYRPGGFKNITLDPLNWKKKAVLITKPLDLITPKGQLAWRSFSFAHPYIFWHKVNEVTNPKHWKEIQKILCRETLVHTYSVPIFSLKRKTSPGAAGILNWLQMAEHDLIKDSGDYHYLTVTDIENFYPSIYTHSICWAIHTKPVGKGTKTRHDMSMLGNRLDRLFQNSRDQQTNGIPVGSIASDLIAEIILSDIDEKLSDCLRTNKLNNRVLIARFRDDYRILSKSADEGALVVKMLGSLLRDEYDLRLNSRKTKQYNDIVEGSFRPYMMDIRACPMLRKIYYGDFSDCCNERTLRDCLVETYRLQKKHPDSRLSVVILSKLAEGFYKESNDLKVRESTIPELVALLRKLTLLREDATPHTYVLLDILLKQVSDLHVKRRLLDTIRFVMTGNSDDAYQLIWIHRLCLSHNRRLCKGVFSKQAAPLLLVLDKKYYPYDYKCFEECGLSTNDEVALEQFYLIDRKKMDNCRSKPINPNSLNPFSDSY